MGYMKITNLYKPQARVMLDLFREVYAMEKIHGTSAHINFKATKLEAGVVPVDGELTFFSGGEKHDKFVSVFADSVFEFTPATGEGRNGLDVLKEKFIALGHEDITVYGEAYGGKCQGMKDTYGPFLKFVAFEVQINSPHHEKPLWMGVERAAKIVEQLDLEFVHYVRGPATEAFVNEQRDKPSTQAVRNGVGDNKKSEGVVLRPVVELTQNNGKRLMAKHKRDDFRETKSTRTLDPGVQKVFEEAKATAEEFVVPERLRHVIDALKATDAFGGRTPGMRDTGTVIKAVIADVKVEEGDTIVWSKDIEKAIGKEAAKVYKKLVIAL